MIFLHLIFPFKQSKQKFSLSGLVPPIANEEILLKYVPTNDNLADFMTKPLTGQKFLKFRDALNLQRTPGF